jgi:hypothetical protein
MSTTDKISLHGVLSKEPRPGHASALDAVLTLAWRAMLKIKHVPFQLFDVLVFPIMMTFMFTYLFGGALAGSTDAYLQWLIPGIVVQTLVFLTIYTGMGLCTDITKGLFERFRSLPIWQPSPIVGALLGKFAQWERWRDDRLAATSSHAPQGANAAPAFGPQAGAAAGPSATAALPFSAPTAALRPPPGVAVEGRRLKRGVPWPAIVVFGVFLAVWMLLQAGVFGSFLRVFAP